MNKSDGNIGEALDDSAVRDIYRSVSNWGRWGKDDELGTLNYITPEKRAAAAKLIREGLSVGLARPVDSVPSPMNSIPAQHHMVAAGDVAPESGAGVAYDHIGIFPHGQAQSHLDALCHISDNRSMFNEQSVSQVTSAGAKIFDINVVGDGIVSRAVFLDIAEARDVPFIEPNEPVRPDDLNRAEKNAGVKLGEGDILVYRTGRHERREANGPQCERLGDGRGHLPGLYPDCLEWIHERKISLIASDCAHDVLPSSFDKESIPIHVGTEVYMGLMLLHNLQLNVLRQTCKSLSRRDFFMSVAPLRIIGGTASPVNPLAIF